MIDLNYLAIVAAAVAVFVVSAVYYIAFSGRLKQLSPAYADAEGAPPPMEILGEIVRSVVVGLVVAGSSRSSTSPTWWALFRWLWRCGSASRWCCSPDLSSTRKCRPRLPPSTPETGC